MKIKSSNKSSELTPILLSHLSISATKLNDIGALLTSWNTFARQYSSKLDTTLV